MFLDPIRAVVVGFDFLHDEGLLEMLERAQESVAAIVADLGSIALCLIRGTELQPRGRQIRDLLLVQRRSIAVVPLEIPASLLDTALALGGRQSSGIPPR